MMIAGVDLAAEPLGTAVTVIDWTPKQAKVLHTQLNLADELIIELTKDATKIGIDCAFGWPIAFADFIRQRNSPELPDFVGDMNARRLLAYRETDRVTREITGRWPLSVSTDRLALTAMRCAGLLSGLQSESRKVDRAGTADVVEIYPGAALRIWKLDTKDYRKLESKRKELLDEIVSRAPWLELGDSKTLLVESCDAFDSFIAALCTRAVVLGKSTKPSQSQLKTAQIEGWIYLPETQVEGLL